MGGIGGIGEQVRQALMPMPLGFSMVSELSYRPSCFQWGFCSVAPAALFAQLCMLLPACSWHEFARLCRGLRE